MYNFIHGWRGKVGVVTLVIAVFVGCWIGSFYRESHVQSWYFCGVEITVISKNGRVQIEIWRYGKSGGTGVTYPFTEWQQEWLGVRFGSGVIQAGKGPAQIDAYSVPYGIVAIPLTLLSVCLVLWNPRKRALWPKPLVTPGVESHP